MIVIHLQPDRRYSPICSNCGRKGCFIHSKGVRFIRDLPLATTKVILRYTYRKLRCPVCGIRAEKCEFVSPYARVTRRFADYVFTLCQRMTIMDVAKHFDIKWKTVKSIDKAGIRERLNCDGQQIAPILAIDEISIRKGHRYLTVVLDYEKGKVL